MVLGDTMVGLLALFLIFLLYIHSVMLPIYLWLEFSILIAFSGGKQEWTITWGQNAIGKNPAYVFLFFFFPEQPYQAGALEREKYNNKLFFLSRNPAL